MRTLLLFVLLPLTFPCYPQLNLGDTVLTQTVVAQNLTVPWDMTYGPDGWIWFTELPGRIKRMHPDTFEVQLIHTLGDVALFGFSVGLHSIVLHPDFDSNPFVYVHYAYTQTNSKIVRLEYDASTHTLSNPVTILGNIPAGVSHNGSRMVIVDGKLFICLGDTYTAPTSAQNSNVISGKVLRMNLDGSIPDDNPTPGSYVWTLGHRNPQGMCYGNGRMYSSEHGTGANDEINVIEMGRNYGWPTVEGVCNTATEMTFCNANNVAEPIWSWSPSIAPCGLDLYENPAIPEWNHSLLLAVLKNKQLIQLKLTEDGSGIEEQHIYLTNVYGRLRDVLVIPDGRVFLCTSNKDYAGTPLANDDKIIELKNPGLGINDPAGRVLVYPSPADHTLHIESRMEIRSVSLLTIDGREVYSGRFRGALDVSACAPGVYCLQLFGSDGQVIEKRKIIIE